MAAAGATSGAREAASAPADEVRYPAPCGYGFPKKPPKRYRFRIEGTVTSPSRWGDGRETYEYVGQMKRRLCVGTRVDYWQTKGTVTQAFENVHAGPGECNFHGYPPFFGVGNAPAQSRPLRHYEIDVGFSWSGKSYTTGVFNPRKEDPFVFGTVRCPDPPAANGQTVPFTFEHISTDGYTVKGMPERVVKGRISNSTDINRFQHSLHWKLKAIK